MCDLVTRDKRARMNKDALEHASTQPEPNCNAERGTRAAVVPVNVGHELAQSDSPSGRPRELGVDVVENRVRARRRG